MSTSSIECRITEQGIVLTAAAYQLHLNANGGIDQLTRPDNGASLLAGEPQHLWRARLTNGLVVASGDAAPPTPTWDASAATLTLVYADVALGNGTMDVRVMIGCGAQQFELWAEIHRHDGDAIKYFYLPDGLEFPVDGLHQFLYPRTYGVSLQPSFFHHYKQINSGYPGPMDFMHLDHEAGQLSLYGIQPLRDRTPFADKHAADEPLLVPGRLHVSGVRRRGAPTGLMRHGWNVWVEAGQTFTTPRYRLALVDDWRSGVADYGAANQITRTLDDKLADAAYPKTDVSDQLETLKRSLLLRFEKDTFDALAETLDRLPVPSNIHFAGWLPNGFDRYYPKHMPPNPAVGNEADFAALCQRGAALGHLIMPYTNYTWWCYDTPYLEEYGHAALQLRDDGLPLMEHYYEQIGYAASMWSPIHRQIMAQEIDELAEIGIDIISIDQMSARPFRPPFMTEEYWWDHNPACPAPYAAPQGMADAAKWVSHKLPLSTEVWDNGPIDYLINWCIQFCGMHLDGFGLTPLDAPSPDLRFAPLVHTLAHDKTIFTWHDLAQESSVWNDYRLSLSLLLGFQLIYVEGSRGEPSRPRHKLFSEDSPADAASWPDDETRDWLTWLSELSHHVVSAYIGQPMDEYRTLAPNIHQATYGPVTITANLGDTAYRLDAATVQADEDIHLAPYGFYARVHATTGDESGVADVTAGSILLPTSAGEVEPHHVLRVR